jgi:aminopeptidase 2
LLALAKEAVESPDRITAVDSLAILNDAYGLARAGYLPSTVLLNVVRTLAHPRQEHALFSGIALILDDLLGLFFADMHTYRAIQRMRRELFGPVVARLGFDFSDDNSAETIQLRTLAIKEAGLAGHEVVVDWALQQWAASIEDGQTLSANTRAVIWSLAVIHIGERAHTRLTDLFVTAKSTTCVWILAATICFPRGWPSMRPGRCRDKTDAVTALCQTTSRDLVDRTLSLIDDVAGVKDIDGRLVGILRGLSTNPRWRAVTWAWTRNHYDALWKVLQGSMVHLLSSFDARPAFTSLLTRWLSQGGRYVPLLTLPRIARRTDLDEAAAFFRTKDTSEFKASLAQTYETVEASIRFLERDADKGDEVARWFRKHGHKAEPKRVVPAPRAGAAAAVRPESSLLYLFWAR